MHEDERILRSGNLGKADRLVGVFRHFRLTILLTAITFVATPALGWAADAIFVVADTSDAAPLAIPSVAAEFGSLAEVSEAVEADRQRMTALEQRIQELETQKAAEPLPAPSAEAAKGAEATNPDKEPDKKDSQTDKDAKTGVHLGEDLCCSAELVEATSSSVMSSRLWSSASTRSAKACSIALRSTSVNLQKVPSFQYPSANSP